MCVFTYMELPDLEDIHSLTHSSYGKIPQIFLGTNFPPLEDRFLDQYMPF